MKRMWFQYVQPIVVEYNINNKILYKNTENEK